jgi:hypothetical protein
VPLDFRLPEMDVEITPEPTDEERAAILAALAGLAGETSRAPEPWLEEDDEP